MAEGAVILATLFWGGGLYLTVTSRALLGALTFVAAWAVWLVFSITTHDQVGIIVAAISLAISLATFWFWNGRGGASGGQGPKSETSRGSCGTAWSAGCGACAVHGPSPGLNRNGRRPSGDDLPGPDSPTRPRPPTHPPGSGATSASRRP